MDGGMTLAAAISLWAALVSFIYNGFRIVFEKRRLLRQEELFIFKDCSYHYAAENKYV